MLWTLPSQAVGVCMGLPLSFGLAALSNANLWDVSLILSTPDKDEDELAPQSWIERSARRMQGNPRYGFWAWMAMVVSIQAIITLAPILLPSAVFKFFATVVAGIVTVCPSHSDPKP